MSQTITVRLTKELSEWLEEVSSRAGVPQGRIIREELERARAASARKGYMRLAGCIKGARDLSTRKGFTR